jgi:hypothetical protein
MKKIILILLIAWILLILLNKTTEKFDVVYYDLNNNLIPEADYKSIYDISEPQYTTFIKDVEGPNSKDIGYVDMDIMNTYRNKVNCCLVEKKFVPINNVSPPKPFNKASFDLMPNKDLLDYAATHDENYMNYGKFAYTYNKLSDEMCDASIYNLDSNKMLLIEGENNWSNEMCTLETQSISNLGWKSSALPRSNQTSNLGSCRRANKECVDFVDKQFCDKYMKDGMMWSDQPCNMPIYPEFIDRSKLNPVKITNDTIILFNPSLNMVIRNN